MVKDAPSRGQERTPALSSMQRPACIRSGCAHAPGRVSRRPAQARPGILNLTGGHPADVPHPVLFATIPSHRSVVSDRSLSVLLLCRVMGRRLLPQGSRAFRRIAWGAAFSRIAESHSRHPRRGLALGSPAFPQGCSDHRLRVRARQFPQPLLFPPRRFRCGHCGCSSAASASRATPQPPQSSLPRAKSCRLRCWVFPRPCSVFPSSGAPHACRRSSGGCLKHSPPSVPNKPMPMPFPSISSLHQSVWQPRSCSARPGIKHKSRQKRPPGRPSRFHATLNPELRIMSQETITLSGRELTTAQVARIARQYARVEISAQAEADISATRKLILEMAKDRELPRIYGFNTGVGMNKDWDISEEGLGRFNRMLINSHSAAVGPEASEEEVRAMLAVRLNCFLTNHTGASPRTHSHVPRFSEPSPSSGHAHKGIDRRIRSGRHGSYRPCRSGRRRGLPPGRAHERAEAWPKRGSNLSRSAARTVWPLSTPARSLPGLAPCWRKTSWNSWTCAICSTR